mmetsp:Transcript_24252/g.75602  ORF Transcript_24252/g.75602 Transcript_24252/m.75602 type:complete len:207 (+) Transcript_24252:1461-2081(+)
MGTARKHRQWCPHLALWPRRSCDEPGHAGWAAVPCTQLWSPAPGTCTRGVTLTMGAWAVSPETVQRLRRRAVRVQVPFLARRATALTPPLHPRAQQTLDVRLRMTKLSGTRAQAEWTCATPGTLHVHATTQWPHLRMDRCGRGARSRAPCTPSLGTLWPGVSRARVSSQSQPPRGSPPCSPCRLLRLRPAPALLSSDAIDTARPRG